MGDVKRPLQVLDSKLDSMLGEADLDEKRKYNKMLDELTMGRLLISAAKQPGASEKGEGASMGRIRNLSEALGLLLKGHVPNILDRRPQWDRQETSHPWDPRESAPSGIPRKRKVVRCGR